MNRILKWYIIFILCILLIAIPIEYFEFLKFGSELEPFNFGIVLLWVVIGTIMYGAIILLRKRPLIWIAIITTFGIIFEFFLNPHQEQPYGAVIFAWFFLFGVCPMAIIWIISNRERVRKKLFSKK
jgi:hypothetical protein